MLSGALAYHTISGGSGHQMTRGFCKCCGAQMVGDAAMVDTLISTRAGTLDEPDNYRPKADVFVSQAPCWDALDPSLPKFSRWPPAVAERFLNRE